MVKKIITVLILIIVLIVPWLATSSVSAQTTGHPEADPVVRVIMFWSSTCGHCEYVLKEVLPPLQEQHGDQLEILLIELLTQEDVDRLFETAEAYGFTPNEVGVPFMIVGDRVLKGSAQIPGELPGLIEQHLAGGGLDYPNISSLAVYLPEADDLDAVNQQGEDSSNDEAQADEVGPSAERQRTDIQPVQELGDSPANGFALAVAVLVAMVAVVVYALLTLLKDGDGKPRKGSDWADLLVPVLALAGMGVAGYLSYVETQAVEAVCGPVGDCNAVQSSSYARLFGVLPIGVLGLTGFGLILLAWVVGRLRGDRWNGYASLAMLGMALFGTFFSIYLTYLEIWVIEAICLWCLSSAILITALLLLSLQPAKDAFDSIFTA